MRDILAQIAADWMRDPYQAFLAGSALGLAVGVASSVFAAMRALRSMRGEVRR